MALTKALGGGGAASTTTQTIWDPDKPPTSANSLDVELSGSSTLSAWPAAWTTKPAGDFDSPTYPSTTPGQMMTTPTGSAWHGKYVAIPAGDFNIAMRGGAFGVDADFTMLALGVSSTTDIGVGSDLWLEWGRRTAWGIRYNTYSPFTIVKTFPTNVVHTGLTAFIRRVGTTYTVGWSTDGKELISFGSISLGFTPSNFIVAAFGSQTDASAFIKWVRYLPSGTATTYGGSRIVLCQ